MLKLFIVRHAKSSWSELGASDHDRKLNDRGIRDLEKITALAFEKGMIPDKIITSTAYRAKATAEAFAEKLLGDQKLVFTDRLLYLCLGTEIAQFLSIMNDDIESLMIVGHNPGITDFFNDYTNIQIDNVPTCAVGSFTSKAEFWKDTLTEQWISNDFIYPKM